MGKQGDSFVRIIDEVAVNTSEIRDLLQAVGRNLPFDGPCELEGFSTRVRTENGNGADHSWSN